MRLVRVIIQNFRGYRERTEIAIDDLTSIIGRNDVGKSTILEALAIFFDCDAVKIDAQDVNVHQREQPCSVTCWFDDLPTSLVLDAEAETTLADEYLLNSDGFLEIEKRWNCASKTIKCEVFARARHPSAANVTDLLSLKLPDLKRRATELGIDLRNAPGIDTRSNVSLRRAIREAVGDLNLVPKEIALSSTDGGKEIWTAIERRLPAFALFRSDRPSRDDDPEVADPMKVAIQEAMKTVEEDLDRIRDQVKRRAVSVAERTLAKLREMDPTLAGQLNPTFKAEPKFDGFKLSLTGDDDIPINKRGSGVRRLILLNFFRAEAERRREDADRAGIIYAIEEPEASLHPDKQRMLVGALDELSQVAGTQVILTTHAPGLAGLLPGQSIRFVERRDDGHPYVSTGEDVLQRVADTLGITPDPRPRPKVLLFVEGPNDVTFLRHICRLLRSVDPNVICIENDPRVATVIVGGGNLGHWVEHQYLKKLNLAEVHIYDRDDAAAPKYQARVDELNRRAPVVWATLTTKREMENYLHPAAIAAALGVEVAFTDECDVPEIVARASHEASEARDPWEALCDKKRAGKQSAAKKRLNDAAAQRMTIEQLDERDPLREVRGWFDQIKVRAEEP